MGTGYSLTRRSRNPRDPPRNPKSECPIPQAETNSFFPRSKFQNLPLERDQMKRRWINVRVFFPSIRKSKIIRSLPESRVLETVYKADRKPALFWCHFVKPRLTLPCHFESHPGGTKNRIKLICFRSLIAPLAGFRMTNWDSLRYIHPLSVVEFDQSDFCLSTQQDI